MTNKDKYLAVLQTESGTIIVVEKTLKELRKSLSRFKPKELLTVWIGKEMPIDNRFE